MRRLLFFVCLLALSSGFADRTARAAENSGQANLSPGTDWPSPVDDSETHGLLLLDLFEYNPKGGGAFRWDLLGWRGGDYNRLWIKSEGIQNATLSQGGIADVQLLFGRLISAYFDVQVGLDYNRSWGRADAADRFQLALGIQGLVPYSFDIEPTLFISQRGEVSGRFTASQDFVFSQRLIAQLRLETNAAIQHAHAFDIGSGLNDISLGLRLRYEFLRELAPYVGIIWNHLFGETADYARRSGAEPAGFALVGGLRAWL